MTCDKCVNAAKFAVVKEDGTHGLGNLCAAHAAKAMGLPSALGMVFRPIKAQVVQR